MADLRSFLPADKTLSKSEDEHIAALQAEIDALWGKQGTYHIDEDAWKSMPLFMDTITPEDIRENEACAALANVDSDIDPDGVASDHKRLGNDMMQRSQAARDDKIKRNLARAATHYYTRGLDAGGVDRRSVSILFTNRSAAQFTLGNFGYALSDAQNAILRDPTYVKAYYRACRAALMLSKGNLVVDFAIHALQLVDAHSEEGVTYNELLCLGNKLKDEEISRKNSGVCKERAESQALSTLGRALRDLAITPLSRLEIDSEQTAQWGSCRPHLGDDGEIHFPLLILYDESSQTDFFSDVTLTSTPHDLLEEILPLPWDVESHYKSMADVVLFFLNDDGTSMPSRIKVNPELRFLDVFRLPGVFFSTRLPTFHVISRHCHFITDWKL